MNVLVLLLIVVVAVAGSSTDQRFILSQGGQFVLVYEETMLRSRSVPLVLGGGDATQLSDWRITTKGTDRRLLVSSTAGNNATLVISADARNMLGARWRYVRMANNLSLVLSNTPWPTWPATARRFQCAPLSDQYFCDLGNVTLANGEVLSVVVDPTQLRGSLPPRLFHLLTHACVTLTPLPITLCGSDVASYFNMDHAERIVIGGALWRARYAQLELDHTTGIITVADVVAPPYGLQMTGVALAVVVWLLAYGLLWATNAESGITYSTHLLKGGEATGRWTANVRLNIASWLTIPAAITGLSIAWVAQGQYAPSLADLPPLAGPNLELFLIFLTIYSSVHLVVVAVLIGAAEFCTERDESWRYDISTDHAWLRNMAVACALISDGILLCYPSILAAGSSGERMILYLLIVPIGVSVFTGWLFLPALFALRRKEAMYHSWWWIGAALELVVTLGWTAAVQWYYLQPVLNASSAYFSDAMEMIAASILVGIVTLLALTVAIIDFDVGVTLLLKQR